VNFGSSGFANEANERLLACDGQAQALGFKKKPNALAWRTRKADGRSTSTPRKTSESRSQSCDAL